MRKLGFLTLISAILVTLIASATTPVYAQTKQIKVENAKSPNTFKGDDLYRQFCAVCHGPDGKGNGPAASALKVKAADLTQLSRQNNSKFPTLHVKNTLTGVDSVTAHGNIEMPTWGDTFKSISASSTFGGMRIDALVEYLQKIQR
jgi:mono/diheme cytochrome c family protein